jgi:hypothetical protein
MAVNWDLIRYGWEPKAQKKHWFDQTLSTVGKIAPVYKKLQERERVKSIFASSIDPNTGRMNPSIAAEQFLQEGDIPKAEALSRFGELQRRQEMEKRQAQETERQRLFDQYARLHEKDPAKAKWFYDKKLKHKYFDTPQQPVKQSPFGPGYDPNDLGGAARGLVDVPDFNNKVPPHLRGPQNAIIYGDSVNPNHHELIMSGTSDKHRENLWKRRQKTTPSGRPKTQKYYDAQAGKHYLGYRDEITNVMTPILNDLGQPVEASYAEQAPIKIDLGDRVEVFDPKTQTTKINRRKGIKPGDDPTLKKLQAAARLEGSGKVPPKEKLKEGKEGVTNAVKELQGYYEELRQLGGIVDIEASGLSNIMSRIAASGAAQGVQNAFGTKTQSIRNKIEMLRPSLIQQVRKATEMGAKGMDSEQELKFYLQTATDVTKDFQANMNALRVLNDAYGLGLGLEKGVKTYVQPEGTGPVHKNLPPERIEYLIKNMTEPEKAEFLKSRKIPERLQ